jgi:hypothetical protein
LRAPARCEKKEGLPFSSELKAEESPALRHIRDHSNYLIPRGLWDVVISSIIYLRGIASNVLVVLPWLLLAAALTITIYPTQEALKHAAEAGFLPLARWTAVALGVILVIWAVFRSWQSSSEIPGFINVALSTYALGLAIVAFVELQPHLLHGVGWITSGFTTWFMTLGAGLATVAGLFGNKLAWIFSQLTKDASIWARVKAALIKIAVFLAAMALPVIVWLIYARLALLGIPASTPDYWVRNLYFWTGLFLLILSFALTPNANSLHRLYRDRLSNAFLFKPKQPQDHSPDPVAAIPEEFYLSDLGHGFSPYHLINAALNIQNSRHANQRGRDAEFFLFSANFIGSDSTRYIKTKAIEKHAQPMLDLGTAMAISGAAAASNMGANLRRWAITLALLNVRLGFWFPNPKSFRKHPWWREFLKYTNFYLLSEMLSLLGENRPFLYLTDGGHIENLGLYQLLRRRCKLIVVVDAEADPKMAFNSFVNAERYARIDLGTRIETLV